MDLTTTEKLTYCTVRIECLRADGARSTGTGSFFLFRNRPDQGQGVPVVVTNKHVVRGARRGTLVFTKRNTQREPIDREHTNFYIDNFESLWQPHPDSNVDLCAMPLAPFIREAAREGINLFYQFFDFSLIPTEAQLQELSAMEEIIMVGYPNGIWDQVNNKPLLRRGITATHPKTDYNGKKEFLIDAACFPGSSGSPVLLLNETGFRDRAGDFILGQPRMYLLGVLYAGPQQTVTGEIRVVDVPTDARQISVSSIPINLGIVIKAERIRELGTLTF